MQPHVVFSCFISVGLNLNLVRIVSGNSFYPGMAWYRRTIWQYHFKIGQTCTGVFKEVPVNTTFLSSSHKLDVKNAASSFR